MDDDAGADEDQLSAPFSAHARGVPLTSPEGFDWGQNVESLLLNLLDISGAALHLLLAQGWLTVIQIIITICSTTFYTYLGVFSVEADLNFGIFTFVVLLPLVLSVFWSICKRDQALRDLADMKTMILHYKLLTDGAVERSLLPQGHEAQLQSLLSSLIDAMRQYFMPQRFYSRHHALMEVRLKMMRIAQGRSRQMLRVTALFHQLSTLQQGLRDVGIGETTAVELSRTLFRLHCTFERMATVKEFRTPQGLRALLLVYIMLIEPLFFGPYYAFVRDDVHSFAFALFLVIVLNLATTSLLQVSIALEDPFDSQALDNIFADEALLEAKLAIQMDRRQAAAYAADSGGMEETSGMRLRGLGRSGMGNADGLPAPTEGDKGDTLPM